MPYQIDIDSLVAMPEEAIEALLHAAVVSLRNLDQAPNTGLSIMVADDRYLQSLNTQFRGEDHPTDVLSFQAGDPIPGMPDEQNYLGDIAISLPYAKRQADHQGHSLVDEMQLLTVHGVLHLVGFDHETYEQKAAMWHQQDLILQALGLGHVQPTESDGEP